MRNSLTALVLALGVGASVIGCSASGTPAPTGSSTISTSASALVDVEAVWQSEPLPNCPKPPIVFNGSVPPGLSLPDKASVARQLASVKSPASEGWVRTKLGWVTKWLAKVRADIISDPASAGSAAEKKTFDLYVKHVGDELREGQDSSSPTDSIYPEGCM
ncbi:Uncharacterised protein [Mycobacteroides abscessus subsp. abscessus]|nr:Uncharacterised protein [Mycobacteroides abscessus subsp. abscessus]